MYFPPLRMPFSGTAYLAQQGPSDTPPVIHFSIALDRLLKHYDHAGNTSCPNQYFTKLTY